MGNRPHRDNGEGVAAGHSLTRSSPQLAVPGKTLGARRLDPSHPEHTTFYRPTLVSAAACRSSYLGLNRWSRTSSFAGAWRCLERTVLLRRIDRWIDLASSGSTSSWNCSSSDTSVATSRPA